MINTLFLPPDGVQVLEMVLAEAFPAFGMETLEKPKAKWEWGISDERVVLNRFYVVAWPGPLCQRTWAGISLSIGVEDG